MLPIPSRFKGTYLRATILPLGLAAVLAAGALSRSASPDEQASVLIQTDLPAMTIAMTSVYVDDPIRAFEFYTDALGFDEFQFLPEARVAVVISPEQPNGTGLLLEPNQNPIASRYQRELYEAGFPVIVFGTADIRAEYERLVDLGVEFRKPPEETPWGTMADFDDTFGNYIRIIQR
jgi:predicted enzyme related to lactoylglutathione lyase